MIDWQELLLAAWRPPVISVLAVIGAAGLLALVHPRWFRSVASATNRSWDTNKVIERLERPVNIDRYILPYSRVLGALVLLSAGYLAFLCAAL